MTLHVKLGVVTLSQLKRKMPINNTSGYRGVSAYNKRGRWRAKYDRTIIGIFDSAKNAAIAYDDHITNLFPNESIETNKTMGLLQ